LVERSGSFYVIFLQAEKEEMGEGNCYVVMYIAQNMLSKAAANARIT